MVLSELVEHRSLGGILATHFEFLPAWELELGEEDFSELLRGIDVECLPGQAVDFAGERGQFFLEFSRHPGEDFRVDAHARRFHVRQDGRKWQLDLVVKGLQTLLDDLGSQQAREFARPLGSLGGRA